MVWKKIVGGWAQVESFGKEHPVLLTVVGILATFLVTAILSAISPLFKTILLQLLSLAIPYWIEVLLIFWLVVLTVAVSRIRTAILTPQPTSTARNRSRAASNSKDLLKNLNLLDGIVLMSCCEQADIISRSDVLNTARLTLDGTGYVVSQGELLNRLNLLDTDGLLHLSMDKQNLLNTNEGLAFYFEYKAEICAFVSSTIDEMKSEKAENS